MYDGGNECFKIRVMVVVVGGGGGGGGGGGRGIATDIAIHA